MYICICKSVTDKQIRRAAAKGVDNLYELRESLGVGAGCGSCADMAEEILQEGQRGVQASLYVPSSA
jgi:bacterioferritin-associated ferredoxin